MPPTEPAVPQEPKKIPNLRRNLDWLIRSTSLTDVLDELARCVEAECKTAFLNRKEGVGALLLLWQDLERHANEQNGWNPGLLRHPLPSAPPEGEQPSENSLTDEENQDGVGH